MNKIEIQDERIDQAISVSKENIKVTITETKSETFQTWDAVKSEGKEVVLEILQPPTQTTLKDVDADISNLESQLAQAQAQVLSLTAELAKHAALKVELEAVVQPAFDANVIAVEIKAEEERIAEIAKIVKEPLPTKEIIK